MLSLIAESQWIARETGGGRESRTETLQGVQEKVGMASME